MNNYKNENDFYELNLIDLLKFRSKLKYLSTLI